MISVTVSTRPGNSTPGARREGRQSATHTGSTDGMFFVGYPPTEIYGTVIKGESPWKGKVYQAAREVGECEAGAEAVPAHRSPGSLGAPPRVCSATALPGSAQAP